MPPPSLGATQVSPPRFLVLFSLVIFFLAASVAQAQVTLNESVDGGSTSSSPVTLPLIQGGTNQTYVLFIATRQNRDVTSVSGGALIWTEQVEQCSGGSAQGIRIWTAQGSPGSAFQVQISYVAGSNKPLSAALSRYSGVGLLTGPTGENTNGEAGACAGGISTTAAQVTLTSGVDGS